MNENYMDQVRQSKNFAQAESERILEPGEAIVLSQDKIRELKRNAEGKIYISNYRVSHHFRLKIYRYSL